MSAKSDPQQVPILVSELVAGFVRSSETLSSLSATVTGIQLDSRLLSPGDLFIALFGRNYDAREFIPSAIENGVAAVLVEAGGEWRGIQFIEQVPVIAVDSLSGKVSAIADRFYSNPSERVCVTGITGTNGKTSCATFLAQALAVLGSDSATIGTLGYGRPGHLSTTALTTPDAVFTQRALAELVGDGVDSVIIEVSSVGLHQRRVSGVQFDTALFTNLTRDHLDYHGTMEAYGANKKKLFMMPKLRRAVINLDDPYALSLINDISASVALTTYSQSRAEADVYTRGQKLTSTGIVIDLVTPIGCGKISVGLLGSFNVSNLLAVAATLVAQKSSTTDQSGAFSFAQLATALHALKPVPGRMEIVQPSVGTADIAVVVDYAHTPDALRSVLVGMREHFNGRLGCLFGAGGNRDVGKRPLMGEIAEQYADYVLLTDDNPRMEDGDEIIDQIRSGFASPEAVPHIRDRGVAIEECILSANPGDVILVAGKGHEKYQDANGIRQPFDDVEKARASLDKRQKLGVS